MRDGVATKISILKLLVGDIYVISTGDVLPADGLCIESHNIQSDESPMTGEPDLIRKAPDNNPFLLSGCKVQTGFGKMVVVAVGMNTQFGILKAAVLSATQERKMTPLQEKLDSLAKRIGYIGMASAAAVLILLLVFWIVEGAKDTANWKTPRFYLKLVTYFTIAVSIIVMAVPEVCSFFSLPFFFLICTFFCLLGSPPRCDDRSCIFHEQDAERQQPCAYPLRMRDYGRCYHNLL